MTFAIFHVLLTQKFDYRLLRMDINKDSGELHWGLRTMVIDTPSGSSNAICLSLQAEIHTYVRKAENGGRNGVRLISKGKVATYSNSYHVSLLSKVGRSTEPRTEFRTRFRS